MRPRAPMLVLGLVLGGVLGLGACDPPSPALRLRLAAGPAQACPSTDCNDLGMACLTWVSIRIVDPADPKTPYLSQCGRVDANNKKNLCSVASIDLETVPLPLRDLEVQVALYPESMIEIDPETGEGTCPTGVQYDAVDGYPVLSPMAPALGGRTYYRPGDEEMIVTLGCTNLEALNEPTCVGPATVPVSATVEDFDLRFSVDQAEASRLSVQVGEPIAAGNAFVLSPGELTALERTGTSWRLDVEDAFTTAVCLTVLDDAPQSTTSLVCRDPVLVNGQLEFTGRTTGIRLRASSLEQMLATIGLVQFPPEGLTIGLVLDANREPVANQVVTATGATIQYLSADRTSIVGSATSASGIFISRDAPFPTTFATSSGPSATARAMGGLIEGKVTIAVLQFDTPPVGND